MSTKLLKYRLSKEAVNRHLVETGEDLRQRQEVEVEMADLTKRQREAIVRIMEAHGGHLDLSSQYTKRLSYQPTMDGDRVNPIRWLYQEQVLFDPLTPAQAVAEAVAYAGRLKELVASVTPDVERAKAEIEAERLERERLQAAVDAVTERAESVKDDENALLELRSGIPSDVFGFRPRNLCHHFGRQFYEVFLEPFEEARKAEAKALVEAERLAWIKANGSERLRLAVKHDHPCGRIYAVERVAKEFPGWTVDFYGKAEWNDRTNPPLNELEELEAAGTETDLAVALVWLTAPPRQEPVVEYDEYEEFEAQAALVVKGFLGKYNLVKGL